MYSKLLFPEDLGPKRSNHDKLVQRLRTAYPGLSMDDLDKYIDVLRRQNNVRSSSPPTFFNHALL